MNGWMKKVGLGMTLAATALSVAAPADAQRYRRYGGRGHGGDVAAGALLGGILGLGVGAAIANGDRGRYYDRGYYDRGYYRGYYNDVPPPVVYRERYYAPPPPPRVIYRDRYYSGGYGQPYPYGGYYGY